MSSQRIYAPWSRQQVKALNRYQESGTFHEYSCDKGHLLFAIPAGWMCVQCPQYRQNWAWEWSAIPTKWPKSAMV